MGMQPSISYKGKEGAPRFTTMERAIALDRPFTMSEFDGSEEQVRYCWDHDYLTIIGADPLTYEVTKFGREKVAYEYEKMEKDRLKVEREAMLEQEIAA